MTKKTKTSTSKKSTRKTKTSKKSTKTKTSTSSKKTKTKTSKTSTKTSKPKTGKPKTGKSRTRSPRPPRGFKPIRATPTEAEEQIRTRLQATADSSNLGGRVRVHRYADGTVDGEYTIAVGRGQKVDALWRKLLSAFGQDPAGLAWAYWLSLGERYVIKEDDEVYRRYKGMNEIATHYTHMARANIAPVFGAARDKMTKGAQKKYRRKAETLFVRLHWNPANDKPRR